MYKITAYRVTLKKRHQIMENVKVLSFLFTPILIFTFLAPIGPLITIIGVTYKLPAMPYCILHIFYNLPVGIIFLRQILTKKCKYVNSMIKNEVTVKNAMEKNITVKSETETYFQKLNLQWK
uniref:Uncharacterized protein n=1 Tax=Panagrolaimus sp. PS1159 TaxID=55785 RepID=A0AC35FGZ3_9BILA